MALCETLDSLLIGKKYPRNILNMFYTIAFTSAVAGYCFKRYVTDNGIVIIALSYRSVCRQFIHTPPSAAYARALSHNSTADTK